MPSRPAERLLPPAESSTHIAALALLGRQRRFHRGSLLIREGEIDDTLFIVLEGRVRVFLADESGRELTLGLYGPRNYVGEMSLDGGPRSVHAEAVEASLCSEVSRAQILSYLGEQPEFALELMGSLVRCARVATESARTVALNGVYGRLVRLFKLLVEPGDGSAPQRLSERMTHLQLAQHLACSREMVSRLLKDLTAGGYVQVTDRWIWLLKPLPERW